MNKEEYLFWKEHDKKSGIVTQLKHLKDNKDLSVNIQQRLVAGVQLIILMSVTTVSFMIALAYENVVLYWGLTLLFAVFVVMYMLVMIQDNLERKIEMIRYEENDDL